MRDDEDFDPLETAVLLVVLVLVVGWGLANFLFTLGKLE